MEKKDILLEIPDEELPKLRDLFKNYWPHAMHAYFYVNNYIEWKNKSETCIQFFCPEGRWDDGTFVAVESHYTYSVFVFTLEKNCSRLRNSLLNTKKICWEESNFHIFFLTVHEEFYPTITNIISEKGMTILEEDVANLWWIKKEDAIKYEYSIPEDVYLASLKEDDVRVINSIWPHKSLTSESYLAQLIRVNGGFGLYKKENNDLCSWIMRNNYGGLAILQTLEEHKRKGYGAIMIKYYSRFWAEKELDIFCFIMIKNVASKRLFEKLGYKKEHGITWIMASTK